MKQNKLVALLLGGGRKVSMTQLLKRSADRLGLELSVVSYELEPHVPIAVESDVVRGLEWDDPHVVEDIVRVAIQHEVDMIIPFADGAISIAAKCASRLSHVYVSFADAEMAETLYDRHLTAEAFRKVSIPAPTAYSVINAEPPVIAKPRRGSTARNIRIFKDIDSLMQLENLSDYVLQEYISEFDEYEIEGYADASGRTLACVPVKLIEVLGGEPTRAITERIPELDALCDKIVKEFSLRGPFLIEVLFDRRRQRYVVTHVAPRLGDAACCAIYAGAPLADLLISECRGLPVDEHPDWKDNTLMTCYRKEAIFYNA